VEIVPGAAGGPLAQTKGAEVERAQQVAAAAECRSKDSRRPRPPAGIGQATADEHQTAERDADGRQAWRLPKRSGHSDQGQGGRSPPPRIPAAKAATCSI